MNRKNTAAERRFEMEDPEANSEILHHDATFNLQRAQSHVGELHMPSRITSQLQNISTVTYGVP
jgi:hypothetical protein